MPVQNPMVWMHFINLPNPSSRTRPWGLRSLYQKWVPDIKIQKCFWGVQRGRCVRLTIPLPSVSRLSRQCRILNISQPYRPSRLVTGIVLFFIWRWCSYLTVSTPMGFHWLLRRYFYFLYIDDIRTSQGKDIWYSAACYRDSFTFYM
jgi:hypothetical protein